MVAKMNRKRERLRARRKAKQKITRKETAAEERARPLRLALAGLMEPRRPSITFGAPEIVIALKAV